MPGYRPLPSLLQVSLLIGVSACGTPPPAAAIDVATWGTMREVLREGRSEARAVPVRLAGPTSIGVGALADLAGEITVLDGRVLVATMDGRGASGECRVRAADAQDAATLLVLAEVPSWQEFALGTCSSYADLERAIAERLNQRHHDLAEPIPVRIRGNAKHLELHVIAGACPIANPSGPRPWRFEGAVPDVELVGFFVEGSAGRLTHHDRSSHLHAVAGSVMGHLDEVELEAAVLWLPAR